tara:strand:+ start:4667 stop:4915 length:249 start_codon:yes stop_codon:yes gene_type:complete
MITVRYFANLREIAGKSVDYFERPELSWEDFANLIEQSQPKIAELIRGKRIMVSVNHDVAGPHTIIQSGDEVALLPPFSGGI